MKPKRLKPTKETAGKDSRGLVNKIINPPHERLINIEPTIQTAGKFQNCFDSASCPWSLQAEGSACASERMLTGEEPAINLFKSHLNGIKEGEGTIRNPIANGCGI